VPICVNLDLHTNLTQAMVEHCTAMIGYKTYPHVDSYETATQIGQVLLATLRGEVTPVMAWGNRPLLAQTLRMGHEDEPMGSLLAMARESEGDGILAATVFGGFPLADFRDAGLSAWWWRMATRSTRKACATGCWTPPGTSARTSSTAASPCTTPSRAPSACPRAP
jgi:microcystin degradation protein MlrC